MKESNSLYNENSTSKNELKNQKEQNAIIIDQSSFRYESLVDRISKMNKLK